LGMGKKRTHAPIRVRIAACRTPRGASIDLDQVPRSPCRFIVCPVACGIRPR
jgi:hypothetical protein